MCRLFGFRSVIKSQVHQSLILAENALKVQGQDHPDGWGVGYYVARSPHVIKSSNAVMNDSIFQKISGVVSSETVLAHIRKATSGELNILNTHPFQHGNWVFAHNGNIKRFSGHREKLLQLCSKDLRNFILGNTDSELLFYLLLSKLSKYVDLHLECKFSFHLVQAAKDMIRDVLSVVGPISDYKKEGDKGTYISFIITNGKLMLAFQGGKELLFSTYKTRCLDRDHCQFLSPTCESPSQSGFVNHLIISSEKLSGESIWFPIGENHFLGVDEQMQLIKDQFV